MAGAGGKIYAAFDEECGASIDWVCQGKLKPPKPEKGKQGTLKLKGNCASGAPVTFNATKRP